MRLIPILFACCWLPSLAAQVPSPSASPSTPDVAAFARPRITSAQQQPRTFRIPFHSVNSMILLDAKVNGRPAVLVLDTAARNTAVSQGDAPTLKLRPGEAADSQAVRVTIELCLGDFVTIKPALALNLDTVQKQMATRFDGILAEDVLKEFSAVRIDFKNHVLELETN